MRRCTCGAGAGPVALAEHDEDCPMRETMTDDELLDATEAAYKLWQDTPRWRPWKRLRRENAWLELCRELQEREMRKARARLGRDESSTPFEEPYMDKRWFPG